MDNDSKLYSRLWVYVMEKIIGKYVNLREIEVEDAEFVLSLRCDEKKARFLNKTEYNIEKQQDYIRRYKTLDNEYYFIIEDKQDKPIGTIRIYDITDNSFCPGSWLMMDGVSAQQSFEGDYLAKKFAFEQTGYNKFHFDVRKGNKKVLRFHELMGAKKTGETELDILFECTKEDYYNNIKKYIS